MEKLNDLFAIAQRADAKGNVIECVNPHDILAIAEAFRALEQQNSKLREERAGLARECNAFEAKLAEFEKQEDKPVAEVISVLRGLQRIKDIAWLGGPVQPVGAKLYTRPAPGINRAELMPDGWQLVPVEPTEEMLCAALKFPAQTRKQYAAMLAAAPELTSD